MAARLNSGLLKLTSDTADILMVNEHKQSLGFKTKLSSEKQMVLFGHTSPTIQSIQKSIFALGSSDKDEDEVQEVQNIASWHRPEAPHAIDSEGLHLYMLQKFCFTFEMLKDHKNIITVAQLAICQE